MNIERIEPAKVPAGELLTLQRFPEERRRAIESVASEPGVRILLARGESIAGAAAWAPLPWDSEIFGFPAGRVGFLIGRSPARPVLDSLCLALLDDAAAHGIRHLTARVPCSELEEIQSLEAKGFEMIDGIQTFVLPLNGRRYLEGPSKSLVRDYAPGDLSALLEIARSSYVYDRFHNDAALGAGVADRAHEEWVRNSCLGRVADHVVVAELGGRVAGFVTCKRASTSGGTAVIPLVATAAWARGNGLARAATLAALDWFRDRGAGRVEVGTQFSNIAAGRLYESCGFRLSATSITLRKVLR